MRRDIDHPASFKDGVRVLLLMLRHKSGGSARTDRKATQKIITTSVEEFDEALKELRERHQGEERIYGSINPRNLAKAIRIFQYRQLDASFFAPEDRDSFYLDLENRWISCLKSPKAAADSLFLIDVDWNTPEDTEKLFKIGEELAAKKIEVVDSYPTKNGAHIITKPFNPSIVSFPVMKDSLMLWSY